MIKAIMNREKMWHQVCENPEFDVVVIGGGASGMGAAVDAASRGYRTLLLEQYDFGKGTSGKSTKLIHGGVRYLQQGNVGLVLEALKERALLSQNAVHLVHDLPFVIPLYDWWEGPFYGIGLRVYDWMAGKQGFGKAKNLSVEETIAHLPTIETEALRGGVIYHDGQFDDARLLINLAVTVVEQGGMVLNYAPVTALLKDAGIITGVKVKNVETNEFLNISSRVVINATGAGVDRLRQMDDPGARPIISASRGTHIVLPKHFLPGDSAFMVPHTDDHRVLFAIPWHNHILVGTTDLADPHPEIEPVPSRDEIHFLLTHAGRYLKNDPQLGDIRSVFTGIRPLIRENYTESTGAISREHGVWVSASGLITLAGGKWTTYRKMGEDVINMAADVGQLPERPCVTKHLPIHGCQKYAHTGEKFEIYGSDEAKIHEIIRENSFYQHKLIEDWPLTEAEVVYFVRYEMARTVEDILSRRHRVLLLDVDRAKRLTPLVAKTMCRELGHPKKWGEEQTKRFLALSNNYAIQ